MLRTATDDGWWLVTHPDHAHLAGAFATAWGNERFTRPEPRTQVLHGIHAHDDGWAARDATTPITREGKPAAFSADLVGKYSAFEEIDLEAYLQVRRSAVNLVAEDDPYAAILISMHTHNLLAEHADRATIKPGQLQLLDAFLVEQVDLQRNLRERLRQGSTVPAATLTPQALLENFRLLQACDALSLLSCVDFPGPASLLHPLETVDGTSTIQVERTAARSFRLTPYPFPQPVMAFALPARCVQGTTYANAAELRSLFEAAPVEELTVTVTG